MIPIKINIYHRSVSTWRLDDSATWKLGDLKTALGIGAASFGSRDLGTGTGMGTGDGNGNRDCFGKRGERPKI